MDNYRKCNIRHDWDAIFLEGVALNPVFAPFATFIGAFAAAAYTAKLSREGKLQNADGSEAEPFAGGNIFAPLLPFKNISILLVGGVFGVIRFSLLVFIRRYHRFASRQYWYGNKYPNEITY